MSIPGLGAEVAETASGVTSVTVPQYSEWRFEVPFKMQLKLKIVQGLGEIFGTELPDKVELTFLGVKYALYTPTGCTLEYKTTSTVNAMTNEDDELVEYISDETAMNEYTNLHFALESFRQEVGDYNLVNSALKLDLNSNFNNIAKLPTPTKVKSGPKVLILGSVSSGKSSLAKLLVSYAVKMNSTPILVNLNPKDGVFSLPGSLTATPISDSLDLDSYNGYGSSTTSGSTFHNPKQPIVKNFGMTNFEDNIDFFNYQISKLGVAVLSRLQQDILVNNSGIIIDTPPLNMKHFNIIENIISDFEVDNLIIIGNEKLSIDLKKKFKHKIDSNQLNIIKISKSSGVVERDEAFLTRSQEACIKEYFNGTSKSRLSPFKTEINLLDLVIYKTALTTDINSILSFLPSGDSYENDENKLESNPLDKYYQLLTSPNSSNLDNSIVAISQLIQNNHQPRDVLNSSILGYVHISKTDNERKKLKILLPFPVAFPRNVLFSTSIGYIE